MAIPLPARVLSLWSVTLMTIIFLVVRVDEESNWNYFVVFVPILVYNGILIVVVLSKIGRQMRRRFYDDGHTLSRKLWFLLLLILTFVFFCLLCSKLNGHVTFSWYYLFIILWIILTLIFVDVSRFLKSELVAR